MLTLVREAMSFVLAMRAAMVQSCMWPREELTLGSWKYVVEEGSSVSQLTLLHVLLKVPGKEHLQHITS